MTNWRPSRKRSSPAISEHSLREVATFGTSALQLRREAYATLEAMQPPSQAQPAPGIGVSQLGPTRREVGREVGGEVGSGRAAFR